MLKYLAAVAAGGTLAVLVAVGIILFFHYVTEERRQKITRAFKARARRPFGRSSNISRSGALKGTFKRMGHMTITVSK